MEIVLIGFMGSGKSTVSQLLGNHLDKRVVDLDQEIVNEQGQAISDIFSVHGEDYFRQLEHDLLVKWVNETGILATGGGTLLRADNAQALVKSPAKIVLLEATGETIFNRLKNDTTRPLANSLTKVELATLKQARQSIYNKYADLVIQTDNLTPVEVANQIIQSL